MRRERYGLGNRKFVAKLANLAELRPLARLYITYKRPWAKLHSPLSNCAHLHHFTSSKYALLL